MSIPYQDRLSGYPPTLLLNLASALSMSVLVMSKGYIYNFPLFVRFAPHSSIVRQQVPWNGDASKKEMGTDETAIWTGRS